MKRPKLLKISAWTGGVILLLCMLLLGLAAWILTPRRLTPLVNNLCGKYLDAEVRFDTVRVSVIKDFPLVHVSLSGARVITHAFEKLPDSLRSQLPSFADTLGTFDKLEVSFDLPGLIKGRGDVRRVRLHKARINAVVAPCGTPNWEIYRPNPADTTGSDDFTYSLNRIIVRDGLTLTWIDLPGQTSAGISLESIFFSGTVSSDRHELRRLRLGSLRAGVRTEEMTGGFRLDSLSVRPGNRNGYRVALMARDMVMNPDYRLDSLRLETELRVSSERLTVRNFKLSANELPLEMSGRVAFHGDSLHTRLRVESGRWELQEVLRLVPESWWPYASRYSTDLATRLDARIEGPLQWGKNILPDATLRWELGPGKLVYSDGRRISTLDTLATDLTAYFRPRDPDSTSVEIRAIRIAGTGIDLNAQGQIKDLTRDPLLDVRLRAGLDLAFVSRFVPRSEGDTWSGTVQASVTGQGRVSQFNLSRISETNVRGRLRTDTVRIEMPSGQMSFFASRFRLRLGKSDNTAEDRQEGYEAMMGAMFAADTIHFKLGEELDLSSREPRVTVNTSALNLARDTTAIHPSDGDLSAYSLRLLTQDSSAYSVRDLKGRWKIAPAPDDPRVPRLGMELNTRMLALRDPLGRVALRDGQVRLGATLYRGDTSRRSPRQPGSTRRDVSDTLSQGRTVRSDRRVPVVHEFADADLDLKLSEDIAAWLRRWEVGGTVKGSAGRVVTPYFPTVVMLRDLDILFNTDRVQLNRLFVKAGESQATLTGEITGLRRAMLGRGRVEGRLKIDADTLNLNQLLYYAQAGAANLERFSVMDIDEQQWDEPVLDTLTGPEAPGLVIVPGNIDLTLDVEARHGVYANILFDTLTGQITARNRNLRLADVKMRSNAGDIRLNGLYSTRSSAELFCGFELEMDRVYIDKLIESFPSIDTLLPMLRSFEGIVDCQLAATTLLDTAMNIVMPSLNAACRITGDSLVLMDGETFAEISKKLMFKNKKRNLIDHISAEILVRDAQVEIFPFVLEIDRYRAAVSGLHRMDMTFDYHISVLKSPIPFRLGVNIFGDIDDFDYKIGKARYKNTNLPSSVELIDTTRINLRNYMSEVFNRGPRESDIRSLRITPEVRTPVEQLPEEEPETIGSAIAALRDEQDGQ